MSSSPTSSSSSEAASAPDFAALGALPCPVTVVLGTGTISVRQCLQLQPNSILRLNESAGDDLRLFVNGVNIARGEVAFADSLTSIRVTELAPAQPRRRSA